MQFNSNNDLPTQPVVSDHEALNMLPGTVSMAQLASFQQVKNNYAEHGTGDQGSTIANQDAQTQPAHATPPAGQISRDPDAYNVEEGVKVAEQVRRGIQRANYARAQTLEGERRKWANDAGGCSRVHPKCNIFVSYAHEFGDPQGNKYPKVGGLNPLNHKPTVDKLADPSFASDVFEYHEDSSTPWKGDVIVWYDPVQNVHHCGIAQGHGEVAYASTDGGKFNTIDDATHLLKDTRPIIRRFK